MRRLRVGQGKTARPKRACGRQRAAALTVSSNATFSGNLYVGTLSGTSETYLQVNTLNLASGADLSGSVNLAANAVVNLDVSGSTVSGVDAVAAGALSVAQGATINVNLARVEITKEASLALLTMTMGFGLDGAAINVTGYDNTQWRVFVDWNDSNTALVASINVIPEPAACAVLLGLAALAFAARRRAATSF